MNFTTKVQVPISYFACNVIFIYSSINSMLKNHVFLRVEETYVLYFGPAGQFYPRTLKC